jgi:hypothetical protein
MPTPFELTLESRLAASGLKRPDAVAFVLFKLKHGITGMPESDFTVFKQELLRLINRLASDPPASFQSPQGFPITTFSSPILCKYLQSLEVRSAPDWSSDPWIQAERGEGGAIGPGDKVANL